MDTYQEMLGTVAPPVQQMPAPTGQPVLPTQPGFAAVTQPVDPVVAQINKPATTPAEMENRKVGWQAVWEKFNTDPTLRQSLMVMGAHMMQPLQPGQTAMGSLGQSAMAGMSAYNAGEYTKYQQGREQAKDQREAIESAANVESVKAGTGMKKVQTKGMETENRITAATADSKIEEAYTKAATAKLALSKATSDEEVNKLERDLLTRKLQIQKDIPDAKIRQAAESELDASILKVNEARARIAASNASAGASNAAARNSNAKSGQEEITLEVLKAMPDAEKKEFLTKTGKYSTSISGVGQQATLWGNLYDKLPADDPHKKGKTKEQFQMQKLGEAKSKDAVELLVKAKQAGMTDEEIDDLGLFDLAKASASEKRTKVKPGEAPAASRAAKGPIRWTRDANGNPVQAKD